MSDNQDWVDELYAEGANEQPPPALDEKIRAAARQPARHPWLRSPGRLTALATAASLVIAVSVIYFEPEQSPESAPMDELTTELLEAPAEQNIAYELEEIPERKRAKIAAGREQMPGAAEVTAQAPGNQPAKSETATSLADVAREAPDALAAAAGQATATELEQLCGPLPGTEQNREISSDSDGWQLTVRVGEDVRTWRCIDGAWIETTSEQHSPQQ